MNRWIYALMIPILFVTCQRSDEYVEGQDLWKSKVLALDGTRWQIASMESEVARKHKGRQSRDWLSLLPACRKDNLYTFDFQNAAFGGLELAVGEGQQSCSTQEPETIQRAFQLVFTEDFREAAVTPRRDWALVKLFDISYEEERFFTHSWVIEHIGEDDLHLKIQLPDISEITMIDTSATLYIRMQKYHP